MQILSIYSEIKNYKLSITGYLKIGSTYIRDVEKWIKLESK